MIATPQRRQNWLMFVACAAFVAMLALAALVPVYTDEIGWRFQERAWIDGVDKLFSDGCGANTLAAPPWFMLPVRWYSATFNTLFAGPAWIRASGVVYALGLAVMLGLVVRRAAAERAMAAPLVALGAGLLALGTTPLLMALSRPEQPILLCMAGALLIALAPDAGGKSRSAWLRSLGIVVLATVALSYHLKALFVMPVFAAAILLAGRGRTTYTPRLAAGALLAAMAAWGALYWMRRLQCPDDAVLHAFYGAHNVAVELTGMTSIGQLPGIVGKLIGNIGLLDYATIAAPATEPMAGWLPAGAIDAAAQKGWRLALGLAWTGALLTGAIAIITAGLAALRARRLPPQLLLAAALGVSALGWAAMELERNVYEAAFELPLLALAVVLACAAPGVSPLGRRLAAGLATIAALAAPVSAGLMLASHARPLVSTLQASGYVLPGQPHSVGLANYAAFRRDTLAAAKVCAIAPDARSQGLLVDDATYLALVRARLPQHQLGVVGLWRGAIQDPVAYLKSRRSDGAVLTCSLLPPELRARARAVGQVCCMGPATGW